MTLPGIHLKETKLSARQGFMVQSTDATKLLKAFAYVDVNAEGELMQFKETVAVNRGMTVKVFSSVDETEKWLLERVT
ncbi:MAG: hypothetical protein OEY72_10345 [Gammaproteobacteria bacterium]|nr:hypothetical protein [Gammaproteobacteria bacterium]